MSSDPRSKEHCPECFCLATNPSEACPYHGAEVARLRYKGEDPTHALAEPTRDGEGET